MASSESAKARAPRGAKAVVTAFMSALDDIPDARRAEVAKAAQSAIRDEVKLLAIKVKEAARKSTGRKPIVHKAAAPKKVGRKAAPAAAKKSVAQASVARRIKRPATPAIAA